MAAKGTTQKKAAKKETTPRTVLAAKDEKKLAAVIEKFPEEPWAERYGRKALKVLAGLRTTPPPIPPELGKEKALQIDEILGYERPKRAAKEDAAKKTKTAAKSKARSRKPKAETTETEPEMEPVADDAAVAGPVAEENPLA